MSFRATTTAFGIALGTVAMSGATASAASGSSPQIRAVYRSVLTAEYFGPASAVCSRLTASGVNSFTAGGQGTCRHAFDALQDVLRHKTPGVDDSGFTAREWHMEVAQVMAHLKLIIHGAHATAIGPSGIPCQTTLPQPPSEDQPDPPTPVAAQSPAKTDGLLKKPFERLPPARVLACSSKMPSIPRAWESKCAGKKLVGSENLDAVTL